MSTLAPTMERMTDPSSSPSRRDAWLVSTVALSLAALIASIVVFSLSLGTTRAGTVESSAPSTAMVHLSEFTIEPSTITIAAGGTLQIMNIGSMAHNLAVEDTKLASPMVDAGGVGNLTLDGL